MMQLEEVSELGLEPNPGPVLSMRSAAALPPQCDRTLRPRTFFKGHYKYLDAGREVSK